MGIIEAAGFYIVHNYKNSCESDNTPTDNCTLPLIKDWSPIQALLYQIFPVCRLV